MKHYESKWRGHIITYDNFSCDWSFKDGCKVKNDPDRPCGHCGMCNTPEGHDGCLGVLPGVTNACCGHGSDNKSYVQFLRGTTIRGEDAISFINLHRLEK